MILKITKAIYFANFNRLWLFGYLISEVFVRVTFILCPDLQIRNYFFVIYEVGFDLSNTLCLSLAYARSEFESMGDGAIFEVLDLIVMQN